MTVNAVTSAAVPVNTNMTLSLTSQASQPYIWFFDVAPGPINVFGVSIPLGFTPYVLDLGVALLPPSGTHNISVAIMDDPVLYGLHLFSCALLLDPSAPAQFVASNGIDFTFFDDSASAGGDAATFSGRSVTLDGSGNLDALTGALPVGTTLSWSVVNAGGASNPVITNPNSVHPEFNAMGSGSCLVRCYLQGGGIARTDDVRIDVYTLNLNGPADNSFATGSVNVSGSLVGPVGAALSLNGSGVVLAGNGSFNAGNHVLAQRVNTFHFEVSSITGAQTAKSVTVTAGTGTLLTSFQTPGTFLRIGGVNFDAIEPLISAALGALPLSPIVAAIPAIPILNTIFLSASIDPTGASHDPAVVVNIFPAAAGIGLSITYNNFVMTSTVSGAIFGAPYNDIATISATSITISGDLVISSNSSGGLTTSVQNRNVVFTGFNFTVTGPLGGLSQLGLIQTAIQSLLVTALQATLDAIPLALNPLLNAIVLSFPLPGTNLTVDLPLETVNYDTAGVVIANRFRTTSSVVSPNAPTLTHIYGASGTTPPMGANSPVLAAPFDLAMGISDGALNQALGTLTLSGAFENILNAVALGAANAGAMAALVPSAGFESFASNAAISTRTLLGSAPLIEFTAGTVTTGSLHVRNLRLQIFADSGGKPALVLEASLDIQAALNISIDPVTGALTFGVGTINANVVENQCLAGYNAAGSVAALNAVAALIVQQIVAPLTGITLPSLGSTGGVVEVSVHPGNSHLLGIYIDLP
ncbi:MAG: hypothetical protein EXS14_01130 [Planctomycetes bacterium]|nr:hypothetical protein [Planctomycetota bacterium]